MSDEIAALQAEVQELRLRIADYENRITWDTTCANCARLLDASYNDFCRAERAEARLAAVRELRNRVANRMMATARVDELDAALDGGDYE